MTDSGRVYKMPWGGEWLMRTEEELAAWDQGGGAGRAGADWFREQYQRFCQNRLAYYLPHCDGAAFINDWESGICLMTKGNRNGGSSHGAAKMLLRNIKCEPDWPCFTKHGIAWHPWRGPNRRVLVATYSWATMGESIWPEIRKLLPREELGEYAENYGNSELYPDETDATTLATNLNFNSGRSKDFLCKKSNLLICFRCYSQPQSAYESTFYDDAWLDEQCPEEKYDGIDERGRGREGFQIWMTLTGHSIPGRQAKSTGKAGWIYRKLYLGQDTKGKSLKLYRLWIEGVPDALYNAEDKAEAYQKWILNPKLSKDKKAQREGEARYSGGFQGEGEIILDNFDQDTHVVPTFKLPMDVTRYRSIDHGRIRPCAALWGAMFSWGDMVVYREYYELGKTIGQNAQGIVAASGNSRVLRENRMDADFGVSLSIYEEQFTEETYYSSVMDCRSFNLNSSERRCTIGMVYNDSGLNCTAGKACYNQHTNDEKEDGIIGRIQDWLAIDPQRKHLVRHLWERGMIEEGDYRNWLKRRGGDTMNGARIYFMDSLKYLQMEMTTWQDSTDRKAADHLISCLKYVLAEEPAYWGNNWDNQIVPGIERMGLKYTGY